VFVYYAKKGIKSIQLRLPNATGPIRFEIKYSVRQKLCQMSGGYSSVISYGKLLPTMNIFGCVNILYHTLYWM